MAETGQNLPAACRNDMQRLLELINPASLLLLGHQLMQELAQQLELSGQQAMTKLPAETPYRDLCKLGRFDMAILSDVEQMQKKTATELIGRIRDFHARHFFVLAMHSDHPASTGFNSDWQQQDFIACGMRCCNKYQLDKMELLLYRFELADYKITPDWFNSKFWANPELFDKYRW